MVQHRLNDRQVGAVDRQPGRRGPSQVMNPHVRQAHLLPDAPPLLLHRGSAPLARLHAVLRIRAGGVDPLCDARTC